jgi:polyisoprenoid-binding protein YceI
MSASAAKFPVPAVHALIPFVGAALFLATVAPRAPAQSQPAPKPASEIVLTVDPAQSTVHFTVGSTLHNVHGTFAFKSGAIHFDPATGKAGGEFLVDTASGESGDDSRDARMKKEILEAPKFPEMIFHPTEVEGKVDPSGASDVKLHGIFSIHGADHEITAIVHAQLTGDRWTATAQFDVPYIAWGIKNPSNFFLKVKPVVNVDLEMSGRQSP